MHISLGQENTINLLSVITVGDDGFLYDPSTVEYKINDLSTGTSTQVHPSAGYESVKINGKYDVGMYYATTSLQTGWSPSGNTGLHNIVWRYTSKDGSTTKTITIPFYVSLAVFAVNYQTYISPNEVRDEGLTVTQCSNARLLDLIIRAQQYIEGSTRQTFRPVQQTFRMDGSESHTIFLPMPIIGIDHIKANNSTAKLATDTVAVYRNPTYDSSSYFPVQDYRRNPRIALQADSNLYSGTFISDAGVFAVGRQNQFIKGVFGFLESDGTCPKLIKLAALRLVYSTAKKITLSNVTTTPSGPIKKERVDRHEVEYVDTTSKTTVASALSSSPEVEEILQMYRAPIGIGTASPRTSARSGVY